MATNQASGLIRPEQMHGGYGEMQFILQSIVNKIQTVMLVQVKKVNATGVNPVGTVDVQIMVAQVDGNGNAYPHGVIYNVPYFRLQGGNNAIVIDPKVGDIGMCGFCSRDISSVKNTKKSSSPQSRRKFDYADGLYFGGFLNGTPTQYVYFKNSGIDIVSTGQVNINATQINLNAPVTTSSTVSTGGSVTTSGNISASGDVSASGTSLKSHTHKGVQPGSGSTGTPN